MGAARWIRSTRRSSSIRNLPSAYVSRGVGNYYLPAAFGGGPEVALKDFQKAIQLDPKLAEAHLWMGIALRKLNRNGEARAAFSKVSSTEPGPRLDKAATRENAGSMSSWWFSAVAVLTLTLLSFFYLSGPYDPAGRHADLHPDSGAPCRPDAADKRHHGGAPACVLHPLRRSGTDPSRRHRAFVRASLSRAAVRLPRRWRCWGLSAWRRPPVWLRRWLG